MWYHSVTLLRTSFIRTLMPQPSPAAQFCIQNKMRPSRIRLFVSHVDPKRPYEKTDPVPNEITSHSASDACCSHEYHLTRAAWPDPCVRCTFAARISLFPQPLLLPPFGHHPHSHCSLPMTSRSQHFLRQEFAIYFPGDVCDVRDPPRYAVRLVFYPVAPEEVPFQPWGWVARESFLYPRLR
jgi:hypothetical protein